MIQVAGLRMVKVTAPPQQKIFKTRVNKFGIMIRMPVMQSKSCIEWSKS